MASLPSTLHVSTMSPSPAYAVFMQRTYLYFARIVCLGDTHNSTLCLQERRHISVKAAILVLRYLVRQIQEPNISPANSPWYDQVNALNKFVAGLCALYGDRNRATSMDFIIERQGVAPCRLGSRKRALCANPIRMKS